MEDGFTPVGLNNILYGTFQQLPMATSSKPMEENALD